MNIKLVQNIIGRTDGPTEHRGIGDIIGNPSFLEQLCTLFDLFYAVGRERDIGPAGPAFLLVPDALAVAD